MPLRLYADVHIPKAIVGGLRARGIDIVTAQEDGTGEMEDEPLLLRSSTLGRVLFTQDKDFLRLASEYQAQGVAFLGIIYAPQFAAHVGTYIEDLALMAEVMDEHEMQDRLVYLPL